MGTCGLGPKKLRLCSEIVGQEVIRAHTSSHYIAMCWVDKHHACKVNYKTKEQLTKIEHQGTLVAYLDDSTVCDICGYSPAHNNCVYCGANHCYDCAKKHGAIHGDAYYCNQCWVTVAEDLLKQLLKEKNKEL